jgi:hypothetical protein
MWPMRISRTPRYHCVRKSIFEMSLDIKTKQFIKNNEISTTISYLYDSPRRLFIRPRGARRTFFR